MSEEKKQSNPVQAQQGQKSEKKDEARGRAGGSVYAKKSAAKNAGRRNPEKKREKSEDEYEQQIIDLARVTRVMAGGKRMRFRACVAIGNKNGKVGVGIAKGADVTIAVNKAVTDAKKKLVNVPIAEGTIPHEILWKMGAAQVLLKPARKGRGVIAGGAVRIILELAGIHNVTSKNLGTNNKVNIAKCTVLALDNLKKIGKAAKASDAKEKENNELKEEAKQN